MIDSSTKCSAIFCRFSSPRNRILSILASILVVGTSASLVSGAEPPARESWDCTAWRMQVPSIQLSDVHISALNEKHAWDLLSTVYFVRPIRINYAPELVRYTSALNEVSNQTFNFQAQTCTVKELLNATAHRYRRSWIQDEKTGGVWIHPVDFDLEKLDQITIEVDEPLTAVPMRSGVLDRYIQNRTPGSMKLQLGPGGMIRGQYPVYRFAEYALDIPSGEHTLRDLLNLACAASPTQSFLLDYFFPIPVRETGKMSSEKLTISTDSIQRPVADSEVLAAYASRYLGIEDGASVDTVTLGRLLSDRDPDVRRASQHYVEMTEDLYPEDYQPHAELSLVQNLWYALTYDRYDKMSHEGYPRVSKYILENVTPDFLLSCQDNHLVLLLSLERARIERDFSWLKLLRGRPFKPEDLRGLEHEVLYIARRCEPVWNALRESDSEYFIDTDGWAVSFMGEDYPEPYNGPSRNLLHPKGMD